MSTYNDLFYPAVHRARDVPELRMHLQRMARERGVIEESEFVRDAMEMQGHGMTMRDHTEAAYTRTQWIRESLGDAELWFVSHEMTSIMEEAAPTVPTDIVLTRDMLIHESGLAVFAHPIKSMSAEGLPMFVSAISWQPFKLRLPWEKELSDAVGFGMWRCIDNEQIPFEDDDQMGQGFRSNPDWDGRTVWMWLGRTDWAFGDELNALKRMTSGELFDETTLASMQHDRQVMMSLWSLATQGNVIEHHRERADRPARRRIERKTGAPAADVLVLKLRGESTTPATHDAENGTERSHDHRWTVRAHWRNQAYGPGRTQRKLILVPPHVKGPEGAPLVVKPRVWTLD